MNNQREIYQALLDGEALVNNSGIYLTLENSTRICIEDPRQWRICNEWEMHPAEWSIINTGEIGRCATKEITKAQKFGMKYHTREAAERARDEMKEANLLRYWVSVIDPDWKADWNNEAQEKSYISYDNTRNKYVINYNTYLKRISTVYMSEKAATKICEALNDGELTLN